MAEEKVYEECCKEIFEILEKNDQVDDLIRELSVEFRVWIMVTDLCGKLLMDSGVENISGMRKIMEDRREFCVKMVEEYYSRVSMKETFAENRVYKKAEGKETIVMEPLLVKGIMAGFCITLHGKRRNACDVNRLIMRAVSIGMSWNKQIYGYRDVEVKQMISRLLLSRGADSEQVSKIGEEMYIKYVKCPYILALWKIDRNPMKYLRQLHGELDDHFEDVLVCVEKEEVAILFTHCDTEEKQKLILTFAAKIAEGNGGHFGISGVFRNRDDIMKKRCLLEQLVKIGERIKPENRVFTEYDYYMELVCSYAYDQIGADGYGGVDLDRLEHEDREKGTDFYKSLKEYLLSGNSVNIAAKRLYIHRNTMVYRLAKIHEIIQIDIGNPDISRRLLLTMILREFRRG